MLSLPGFTCPEPVEENPETDVAIHCGPCGLDLVIPITELMKGLPHDRQLPPCQRDKCAATVLTNQVVLTADGFLPAGPPRDHNAAPKKGTKK